MSNQFKKILVIFWIITAAVALIFAIVFLAVGGFRAGDDKSGGNSIPSTGELIENVKEEAGKDEGISETVTFERQTEDGAYENVEAVVVAAGSNPIEVETGKVLTLDGKKEADNSTLAGNPDAPLQSDPINPENLPDTVVRIIFEKEKIEPAEFRVKAGQAVSLSVTASSSMEVFKFQSSLLSAVAMGLAKEETRVITFNAPEEKGEYVFYSDMPARKSITGKMIVE